MRGKSEMKKEVPPELDRIADVVLKYKPKAKSKAAKRRKRRAMRRARTEEGGVVYTDDRPLKDG